MSTPDHHRHHRIVIVGSGFAGLGSAIRLKQRGEHDFVLLERADRLGGTWRDNSYPGCACDVPSHLYSFSFALNPDWTRLCSPQAEIQAYLERVAGEHGIPPHIRFGHEMLESAWNEERQLWEIQTSAGSFTAEILISGMGGLSEPALPALKGLDSFQGTTFHSAQWNHDHALAGERVAVIGTGASAVQFIPEIQPEVGELQVYQRTAPWIVPRRNAAINPRLRRLFQRFPPAMKLMRGALYWSAELLVLGLAKEPRLMRILERVAEKNLARQVPDPALRAKLKPSYRLGCKRILFTDQYLPALAKPNVEVVDSPILEVRPHSILTADGTEHAVDTIIFGTGFHVTDQPLKRFVRERKRNVKSGQIVEALPWESKYQLLQPPAVQTVPWAIRLISATKAAWASGRTSTAAIRRSSIASSAFNMYSIWASIMITIEVCPSPVKGPSRTNRFGKPVTVVPLNAAIVPCQCSASRRPSRPRTRSIRHLRLRPHPSDSGDNERRGLDRMSRKHSAPFDVNGRTVFITGAARGIGAETARRLHGKGANVALVGLSA